MSKLIALPILIASAAGFYFAVPGFIAAPGSNAALGHYLAATAIACALLGICILAGAITLPRRQMKTIQTSTGIQLLPTILQREIRRNALVVLLAIWVPAALLAIHAQFALPGTPVSFRLIFGSILLTVLLIIPFRRAFSWPLHGELNLTITPGPPQLDRPFQIHIQFTRGPGRPIQHLAASIICFEHDLMHAGRYVHHTVKRRNEIALQLPPIQAQAGETFAASAEVMLDSIQYPPSGPWGTTMYPYYRWEIQVDLSGHARSRLIFPLLIKK